RCAPTCRRPRARNRWPISRSTSLISPTSRSCCPASGINGAISSVERYVGAAGMSLAGAEGGETLPGRPGFLAARLRRIEPARFFFLAAIAVLVFLIVAPVVRLLASSFQSVDDGSFTVANYVVAWSDPRNLIAVGNSIRYAIEVTILSAVFAVPIAWGVSRTDMPAKSLVRALIIGAFITPPYLGSVGWILLGGPNAGWLNRAWMGLTGSSHGFMNVFSFEGMVLVTALYSFPYIFVFTSAALD